MAVEQGHPGLAAAHTEWFGLHWCYRGGSFRVLLRIPEVVGWMLTVVRAMLIHLHFLEGETDTGQRIEKRICPE